MKLNSKYLQRIDTVYIPFEIYAIKCKHCKKLEIKKDIPVLLISNGYDKDFSNDYFLITIEDKPKVINSSKILLNRRDLNKLKHIIQDNKDILLLNWLDKYCILNLKNNYFTELFLTSEIGFSLAKLPIQTINSNIYLYNPDCNVLKNNLKYPFILIENVSTKNLYKISISDIPTVYNNENIINICDYDLVVAKTFIRNNKNVLLDYWMQKITDMDVYTNENLFR